MKDSPTQHRADHWSLIFAQEFYLLISPSLPRIDITELIIINHIAINSHSHTPTYGSDLTALFKIPSSTVHDTLNKFAESGLLVAYQDPSDGRRTAYQYSPDTHTSIRAWSDKLHATLHRVTTEEHPMNPCPACGRPLTPAAQDDPPEAGSPAPPSA